MHPCLRSALLHWLSTEVLSRPFCNSHLKRPPIRKHREPALHSSLLAAPRGRSKRALARAKARYSGWRRAEPCKSEASKTTLPVDPPQQLSTKPPPAGRPQLRGHAAAGRARRTTANGRSRREALRSPWSSPCKGRGDGSGRFSIAAQQVSQQVSQLTLATGTQTPAAISRQAPPTPGSTAPRIHSHHCPADTH